jgi:hypothetical protein
MKRITLKDFKRITRGLPEDAIICCQSNSEGNENSTCLDIFVEKVGKQETYNDFSYVQGDNIIGIDLEKDKDKIIIIMQPSL